MWPQTRYVVEDDFELVILLPPVLKSCHSTCALSCPIYVVLGIEPGALCMPGKSSYL